MGTTRNSQAALAWIARPGSIREPEYLVQWNDSWQAYSLVGGHVEPGETFRAACLREIEEELECQASACEVAPRPHATLRFRQFSRAAGVETDYHWQVFQAHPSKKLLTRLPATCTWLHARHILAGQTAAGRPVAEQVRRVWQAV